MGVLVVAISIVIMRVQPNRMAELPTGMATPVIALELVRTPAEVERIFGSDPAVRESYRLRTTRATWIDFALLAAYGTFLAGVARELSRAGSRAARLGVVLALSAAVFDAVENMQLLTIFDNLGGHYEGALSRLVYATWAKWLCLAAYFASIAAAVWAHGGVARVAAVSGGASAVAAVFAVALRGVPAEIMANGIAIAIAALVVAAYRQRVAEQRAQALPNIPNQPRR